MIEEKRGEDDSENEEDEDTSVTSTLSIGDKELELNPSMRVIVNRVLATDTDIIKNGTGVVETKSNFKVREIQFGEGQEQPKFKLLTPFHMNIYLEGNSLPIKKADLTQDKYFQSEYFKKEYKEAKSNTDDFSMTYQEWIRREQDDYFEVPQKLNKKSREKIKNLSNDEILDALTRYQINDYHTDSKLRKVMFPHIIQHDKTEVEPNQAAKYQPHTQMWTNTKVGKSNTAQRAGKRLDDATIAGLVGYADTDGVQDGVLDGKDESIFIDEFNFGSSSDQLNDQLLSIMESGEFEQTKAGRRVMTRFYGAISYMANPQESEDDFDSSYSGGVESYQDGETSLELISKFRELIEFLGYNIEAMGSRFGVILFDQEMDEAEEIDEDDHEPMSRQEKRRLETFVQWLIESIRPKYTEIERQLSDWLEQEYPDSYKSKVEEIATTEIKSGPVIKFWKSHAYSYRHARGHALRTAVYRNIGDVLNDNITLDELRNEAENAFEDVKRINLESLKNMTKATKDYSSDAHAEAMVEAEDPLYCKLFVKTFIYHWSVNDPENSAGSYEPMAHLKESWQEIKHDIDDINEDMMYWAWHKLSSQIEDNVTKIRRMVKPRYGINIREISGEVMVCIQDHEMYKKFEEVEIVEKDDPEPLEEEADAKDEIDDENHTPSGESTDEDESSTDTESDSDDIITSEDELKIQGDYNMQKRDVIDLFKDNESSYENSEIPHKDLRKYFGRKVRNPSKLDELAKVVDDLKNNGLLIETPSGNLRRGSNY